MSEARKRILRMLAEGKITVEQSEELLVALEEDLKNKESVAPKNFKEDVKKVASQVKSQVTEAIKNIEPHAKEIKSKLKELGGWIQDAVKTMSESLPFISEGPKDGLDVEFQISQPQHFDRCKECEINLPRGEISIKQGDSFGLFVRGKISKAALESLSPADWFMTNLFCFQDEKLTIGMDKSAGYKALLKLELTLPSNVHLKIASMSADLIINGEFSISEITSVSGDVEIRGCRLEGAPIETVSGDVELENVHFAGRAHTTSGDIFLNCCEIGKVAVHTVSGDITFERPILSDQSQLSLESTSGDIKITKPRGQIGNVEAFTKTGDIQWDWGEPSYNCQREIKIRINDSGACVRAETVSGDISFI